MDADPVLEAFLRYPFYGEIPLGNGKSNRVDLSVRDSSSDGDGQCTPAGADFQDAMSRLYLRLGNDVPDFAHLSRAQVVEDVLGGSGGGRRRDRNTGLVKARDGIVRFPTS